MSIISGDQRQQALEIMNLTDPGSILSSKGGGGLSDRGGDNQDTLSQTGHSLNNKTFTQGFDQNTTQRNAFRTTQASVYSVTPKIFPGTVDHDQNFVRVNPRLHAVPKFVINHKRNPLSLNMHRTAAVSPRHSSLNPDSKHGKQCGEKQRSNAAEIKGLNNFAKQFQLYKGQVSRTKPASLFQNNPTYSHQNYKSNATTTARQSLTIGSSQLDTQTKLTNVSISTPAQQ